MRKQKYDYFAIWLGITLLAGVILAFFAIIRYQPDFFRDIALIP